MQESFRCAVCSADDWRDIRTYEYDRSTADLSRPPLGVLFNVWFPDDDPVQLTSCYCGTCGFVCYRPRPTVADIARKYEYLYGVTPERSSDSFAQVNSQVLARAGRIFRQFAPLVSGRIVDVGGGHGQILTLFVEAGFDGDLVDVMDDPMPGVRRIAPTLEDLDDDAVYDAAICSHVLEHVADPADLLRGIRRVLKPEGLLIAEVPMQVWVDIPIASNPVTHINFFTPLSYQRLFVETGWEVQTASNAFWPGEGSMMAGVVIASPAAMPGEVPRGGPDETRRLLNPTWVQRAGYAVRSRGGPIGFTRRVARRLRSAVGGRLRR